MERFPRGSMPPSAFAAVATLAPTAVSKPPQVSATPPQPPAGPDVAAARAGGKQCDLSTTCPQCGAQMRPEHAHYRCGACGYRDSCCF